MNIVRSSVRVKILWLFREERNFVCFISCFHEGIIKVACNVVASQSQLVFMLIYNLCLETQQLRSGVFFDVDAFNSFIVKVA